MGQGDIRLLSQIGMDIFIRVISARAISENDYSEQEGLPYQTYVSSILHKFINGLLVEGTTK